MDIISFIRDVHDFPKQGIIFKDITPLLADGEAFEYVTSEFAKMVEGYNITKIVGIESRGFIFGCALANKLGLGFVPIRKPKKLPYHTYSESYDLEYGSDTLEIHEDALTYTDRVLLIDDLLATGGTASAAIKLVNKTGADIKLFTTLIELTFLNGREKFPTVDYKSIIQY